MQWEFGSTIVPHLSKLWKVTFFMLCYVILRMRLQEKFEFDQSPEWKTLKNFFVRCLSSDEHMTTLEHKKGEEPVEICKEEPCVSFVSFHIMFRVWGYCAPCYSRAQRLCRTAWGTDRVLQQSVAFLTFSLHVFLLLVFRALYMFVNPKN